LTTRPLLVNMDLSILLFNFRGITTLTAQRKLRRFLKTVRFDILFLQETKLHDADWAFIVRRLWRDGVFVVAPAAPGAHPERNSAMVSRLGGLATAVRLLTARPPVSYQHITVCGRAINLHIDGLPFGPLGLLNIYASNKEMQRSFLWERLAHLVDADRPWLIGGNFNMTLLSSDHRGGSPQNLAGQEAVHWAKFLATLGLSEYPPFSSNQVVFTWNNKY
jgi:exonuclease III